MNENNSTQVRLTAWKTQIDVMEVKIKVDEREYCEVLTKLFNNKREYPKDFIDIYNCFGSNLITFVINLTHYDGGDTDNRQDTIDHILRFANSCCNYEAEVNHTIGKAYLYEVDEYRSKIEYFDEKDNFYFNYITMEM